MKLTEMVTEVRSQLAEPVETVDPFWTDTEIKSWINEGYKQFCMATKIVKDMFIKTVAIGIKEKSIETEFVQIDRIEWKNAAGDVTELLPMPIEDVDFSSDAESGIPVNYYLRSGNVIGIEPTTDAAGTLQLYFSYIPAVLGDNDSPLFPSMFHNALVEFALWKARIKYKDQLYIEHKTNFRDLIIAAVKQTGMLKKKTTGIRPRIR